MIPFVVVKPLKKKSSIPFTLFCSTEDQISTKHKLDFMAILLKMLIVLLYKKRKKLEKLLNGL